MQSTKQPILEELGLRGNEARVLLAVLRLGTANSLDVAGECGISRTNVYRVLGDLGRRRLVERLPGDGPATWASPGIDEVLDRLQLDLEERLRAEQVGQEKQLAALHAEHERRLHEMRAAHDERINQLSATVAGARDLLAQVAADAGGPLPKVQLIPSAAQLEKVYDDLLGDMQSELLVLVRPPYAHAPGNVKPSIVDALSRGVQSRVIYEAAQLDDPEAEGFRREIEAYHRAGVEARVVEHLPLKLAVFDRAATLVALVDSPGEGAGGYPTFLLVEHEGFAVYQAEAFDHRWADATPYSGSRVRG